MFALQTYEFIFTHGSLLSFFHCQDVLGTNLIHKFSRLQRIFIQ